MKKIISVFLIVSYLSSFLFAGTMFVQPGDRATGMGGAFTAVADDATAIYYNPAGLTQLENSGAEFASFYVDSKATSTKPLQNNPTKTGKDEFPIPSANLLGYTEPANYNSKDLTVSAYIPFLAGYNKINDINVAIGIYGIGGGTGKWSDAIKSDSLTGSSIKDDIYSSLNKEYSFMIANISGAKKVSDKVSVGVGLNLVYMKDSTELKKNYVCNSASIYNYDVDIKRDGNGYGFEATGGVLYSPIDYLRLGLTLRSGTTIKVDGTANYTKTGISPQSTNYHQNYSYPFTYSLGIAYDATERLLLSFSADIADYSTMKDDYTYDTQIPTVFDNGNTNSGWKTTTMLSLGAKYKVNDKFDLLAGIRRDPSAYPQDKANLLNTDQYDLTILTIGSSYKFNSFKIGFSVVDNISDGLTRDNAEYEFNSIGVRGSVSYNF